MISLSRKIISLCAATTLACAGAGIGAPAAFAADDFQPSVSAASVADTTQLNPDKEVTLNIVKYEGEKDQFDNPLQGVKFKVVKVKNSDGSEFDLTQNESWKKFNDLLADPDLPDKISNLGKADGATAQEKTTGADGQATFTFSEGAGIYRVEETEVPKGYSVTAPFLVALPGVKEPGTEGAGQWSYERTVKPKNQKIEPTKEVDDSQAAPGGTLKYRLSAPVTANALNNYTITDTLVDSLQYDAGSVEAKVVKDQETATLAEGDDYELTAPSDSDKTLTIDLTKAGIKKIKDFYGQHVGAQVQVTFTATVASLPTNGKITNTANFNIDGTDYTTDKDETPASTSFADVIVTKTSSSADVETANLQGAEFEIYRCVDDSGWKLKGAALSTAAQSDGTGDKQTVLTTALDGDDVKAKGYGVPAVSNSTDTDGTVTNDFCVIETKAPAGFVKNPEVIHLTQSTPSGDGRIQLTADIDNQKANFLNQLPSTGAWGIVLVFLLGLLLLARGLYTTRRDSQATA